MKKKKANIRRSSMAVIALILCMTLVISIFPAWGEIGDFNEEVKKEQTEENEPNGNPEEFEKEASIGKQENKNDGPVEERENNEISLDTESGGGETSPEEENIEIDNFIYNIKDKSIIAYTGSENTITIPAVLKKDGKEYSVKAIGEKAFYSKNTGVKLNKVVLEEGIETIGKDSFAENTINEIEIPASIKKIGERAFSNSSVKKIIIGKDSKLETIGNRAFYRNTIKEVDLTKADSLITIGEKAFSDNGIKDLKLGKKIVTIGEEAFSHNHLDEINLPKTVTSYGENVFVNNDRYVFVYSDSEHIKSQITENGFGSICNPTYLWIEGYETDEEGKMTDTIILSKCLMENDPYVEKPEEELIYKGNTVNLTPPRVKGYIAKNIEMELNEENLKKYTQMEPYKVSYMKKDELPVIEGLKMIKVKKGDKVDREKLLEGVTAKDSNGNDLTSHIKLNPDEVDTSVEGTKKVLYSVEDGAGNETVEVRYVFVGIDPMKMDTGKGWKMEDFEYDLLTGTVKGLSESGKKKAKVNKEIVLPDFNPRVLARKTPITEIADDAFKEYGFIRVILPESIEKIGKRAFMKNDLFSINLPESLSEIEKDAFRNNKLTSVVLPEKIVAGEYAFAENRIQQVSLPDSMKEISKGLFYKNRLTGINFPIDLEKIGEKAFYENTMDAAFIPEKVVEIEADAFRKNLIANISLPNSVKKIGTYAFAENNISGYNLPKGIKEIPKGLFSDNRLFNLHIPASVNKIGENAFEKNKLLDIEIPKNIEEIGKNAFDMNYDLSNLKLNEGLVKIGENAFYRTGLEMKEFVVPETVREIGSYAFSGSSSRMVMRNVKLPENLEVLGSHAFDTSNVYKVNIPSTLKNGVLENCVFANNKLTEINLPDTITEIKYKAFSHNYIEKLKFPENVKNIGNRAFEYNRIGGKIVFPESVKDIYSYAFDNNEIREIKLPNGLNSLGEGVFKHNLLTEIEFPEKITDIPSEVCKYNLISKISYKGKIKTIGSFAFYRNRLQDAQIPETVVNIRKYAFAYNDIKKLQVPNSVNTIEEYAFDHNSIESLKLPENNSYNDISRYSFSNNSIKKVIIPDNVKCIKNSAFYKNAISEIEGGKKVERIESEAFRDNLLRDVVIYDKVSSISDTSFKENPGWDMKPSVVRLIIRDGKKIVNPNNLKNSKYYVINEGALKIEHNLKETGTSVGMPDYIYGKIGETYDIEPIENLNTHYYVPANPEKYPEKVEFKEKTTEKIILYTQDPEMSPDLVEIMLYHAKSGNHSEIDRNNPFGLKSFVASRQMPMVIRVHNSSETAKYDDLNVVIDCNSTAEGGHIKNVIWPSNISEVATKGSWSFDNGYVKFKLKKPLGAGDELQVPIKFVFDTEETPENFTLDLSGRTKLSRGGFVVADSSERPKLDQNGDVVKDKKERL